MDECVICKKTTNEEDQAMECDLCEGWEHVGCVRQSDRLSHELYEALIMCRSKALLYECTRFRKKGSVNKRLHEYEVENTHVQEQRLASVQTNERLSEFVGELGEEK